MYEQLQKIVGRKFCCKNVSGKIGEIRAKYPLRPQKLPTPSPMSLRNMKLVKQIQQVLRHFKVCSMSIKQREHFSLFEIVHRILSFV